MTLESRKSGWEKSRYWLLYKMLNEQEIYDEAQLSKKLSGTLSHDKRRLYETILRSMRSYRSQLSQAARIKEYLLDANFLYDRGLYEQAYERLRDARALARKLDDQLAGLEVNKEIRRVANTLLAQQQTEELSELVAEKKQLVEKLEVELELLDQHDEIIRAVQASRSRTAEIDRSSLSDAHKKLLTNHDPPESTQGKLRYYQSRGLIGTMLGDHGMSVENYKQVLAAWAENPAYKEEEFNRYLDDAFNLLSASFKHAPALHTAPDLLQQLEAEEPASAHDRKVLFQRTATYRLVYYINYDNQKPAAEVLGPIQEGLEQYQLNAVSELTIRFNAAVLHFLQDNPSECESWLMPIIDSRRGDLRPDIVIASRLLRITTLFDQAMPFDFLESQLRSEGRFLQQQQEQKLRDFGRFWLRSIRQISQAASKTERTTLLKSTLKSLEKDWLSLPLGLDELLSAWLKARTSAGRLLEYLG
ncbi:MAG: hypothetical protein AAGF87_17335 [Bacteroidota bacterium]